MVTSSNGMIGDDFEKTDSVLGADMSPGKAEEAVAEVQTQCQGILVEEGVFTADYKYCKLMQIKNFYEAKQWALKMLVSAQDEGAVAHWFQLYE